jgi:RNA polymerase sigma factor (sigma-70 family)
MAEPHTPDLHPSIDAIWRIESGRLIAALTRIVRDVGLAEDLAQDALVAALERWPHTGIPSNPGAWLMASAKNRAIDLLRRNKLLDRKHQQLGYELESTRRLTPDQINAAIDDPVGDDLLRLIFISCHPILAPEARAALTLRLLGGLTTSEIARAFLVPEPTIAQRIVRAKRTLSEARIPFEVPRGDQFTARLASVLQVIYLIFNEGYSATSGDDWTRPALCEDALRLGRVLAELVPDESEVHGLIALMEIQASRLHARIGPNGEPILLLDQDRSRWDQILIHRGLAALEHAESLLSQSNSSHQADRPDTNAGAPSSARDDVSRHETKVGSQNASPTSQGADAPHLASKRRPPQNASPASPGAPSSARDDVSRHETKVGSQDASGTPNNAGPYTLQAAIAACHARALTPEATDWRRIAWLYTQLLRLTPSPIIELNRAVAISMASGPAAALPLIDALTTDPALKTYHLLPSVRGDLLHKLGRHQEARAEFERAAALTRNARERTLLLNRAKATEPAS